MLRRAVLPYRVRRDGVLFLHVEWDRVGWCVPGLRRGRGGSAGGLCGRGGADGDVYAGRGVADVFDTGCERVCRGGGGGVSKTETAATSGTAVQTSASGAATGGTEQVGVTRVGGGATGGAVTGGGSLSAASSVASGAWGGRGRGANVIGANIIAVIAVGCVLHALL